MFTRKNVDIAEKKLKNLTWIIQVLADKLFYGWWEKTFCNCLDKEKKEIDFDRK